MIHQPTFFSNYFTSLRRSIRLTAVIALVSCMAFLSSCVSYKNTSRVGAVADSKISLVTNVADVEVDFKTKITAASAKTWCVSEAKEQAYYRAVVNNNIDILVDPIYEVKTRGKRSIATVTGYAGHYKNIRTTKDEKQEVFEQDLKNAKTTFEQSMKLLDQRLVALDKFSKVDAVAKEDLKTYLIIPGGCSGGNSTTTEKELNTEISIVDKYTKFASGGDNAAAAASSGTTPVATPIPVQSGPAIITPVAPSKKKK